MDNTAVPPAAMRKIGHLRPGRGLTRKLLWTTMGVVAATLVLVFVFAISHFHHSLLADRLRVANIVAAALWCGSAERDPDDFRRAMLQQINALVLAGERDDRHWLLARAENPPTVERRVDINSLGTFADLVEATQTLLGESDRVMEISGDWTGGGRLDVVIREAPLRVQMNAAANRILVYTLLISFATGLVVFFGLRHLFVRPIEQLARMVEKFEGDPENPARILVPRAQIDELGQLERSIAAMQTTLQETLKQQRRLADVGLGVSKINHDLRNLLTSAQLVSDRLVTVPDPTVQRFAPKLFVALDRAINYCQAVLAYGKASEPIPQRRLLGLQRIVQDAAEVSGAANHAVVRLEISVPDFLEIDADADQLFRILMNLMRNSVQALEAPGNPAIVRRLIIRADRRGSVTRIHVADTGPGIPEHLRGDLFRPFHGSLRPGGSGLGLAIAAELVRAHGGSIVLLDEGPGTTFEIEIPDRPISFPRSTEGRPESKAG